MSFLERALKWFRNIVHHEDRATVEVERGDTLWAIVKDITGETEPAEIRRHVDEIVALNPGLDPDKIQSGQVLNVPLEWV